jgi:alpha-methylacyl-CoA racemase
MGPLHDVTVVELAGIGPAPFCAMTLADMGARVIRVDPPYDAADYTGNPVLERGRESIRVDLKQPVGQEIVLRLVATADVLLEGFRPGVAERLGVGPETCLAENPRLVYGRMTGWGQSGPLALRAGHDINYIALTGALHAIGRAGDAPVPPLNLVGDFGGGAMYLAFGIVCALLEARRSGQGQVVDAAVVDGTTSLLALVHGLRARGLWTDARGSNLLDTGAPWYDVYECRNGGYMAVGALEEKFFLKLLDVLGLGDNEELRASHRDRARWPLLRTTLTRVFATRDRHEWTAAFDGLDACCTPVLTLAEAEQHPHAIARGLHSPLPDPWSATQPAPAPRFSRTPAFMPGAAPRPGEHTRALLAEHGYSREEIDALVSTKTIAE